MWLEGRKQEEEEEEKEERPNFSFFLSENNFLQVEALFEFVLNH